MTIALIGAGAAGAACVSVLRSRGADFHIFDKSRGVGGRLTTRRISGLLPSGEITYDHGAGKFSLNETLIKTLAGHIGESTLQTFEGEYVAQPTMPQLIKDLLGATKVNLLTEIESIDGTTGEWWLMIRNQDNQTQDTQKLGPFSKVICTAPAPQALKLLSGVHCRWKDELKKVHYDPCWTLMLTLQGEHPQHSLAGDEIFAALTQQTSKPGRQRHAQFQSWVAHAGSTWSAAHLEQTADHIGTLLLPRALSILNASANQVLHTAVHRWRFAQVSQSLGADFLSDDLAGLYYAGDGCRGTGVEGALYSGLSVALRVLQTS